MEGEHCGRLAKREILEMWRDLGGLLGEASLIDANVRQLLASVSGDEMVPISAS